MTLQERIRHLQELAYKLDDRKRKEDLIYLLKLIHEAAADTGTVLINHDPDAPHSHPQKGRHM